MKLSAPSQVISISQLGLCQGWVWGEVKEMKEKLTGISENILFCIFSTALTACSLDSSSTPRKISENFFIPDKKEDGRVSFLCSPMNFLLCALQCKKETHSHHLETLVVTADILSRRMKRNWVLKTPLSHKPILEESSAKDAG